MIGDPPYCQGDSPEAYSLYPHPLGYLCPRDIIIYTIYRDVTLMKLSRVHRHTALALLLLGLSAESVQAAPTDSLQIIPRPASVVRAEGSYTLPKTLIMRRNAPESLRTGLERLTGRRVMVSPQGSRRLRTLIDPRIAGWEGYRLEIGSGGITLSGRDQTGLQQGVQTLLQLVEQYGDRLPQLTITDSARFAYRGVMLDVSRHFMRSDMILRLLDEMARYKLNRFHWHLVDGGGWRFPSTKYPLLTKKAAYRMTNDWDSFWQKDRKFVDEGTPGAYGGYYTRAEIRQVVEHATRLGITVIPEIEMPGHSNEIFAAYPELSCRGRWDFASTDLCIGKEQTFRFVEDILSEVMELFPSRYIHIGGDEAAMNHWGSCPDCRRRMEQEGLKDEHELQSYMIRRVEKYLNSKGRKLIGWDEILMGGLAPDATVMSWRGEEGGIAAAQSGHDVIMTPGSHVYLDFYQRESDGEPRANGGFTTLEKVYSYNPVPAVLKENERKHILGAQANLWTEYVLDERHAEYMLFPRILALAELTWSPQSVRSYPDFLARVNQHLPRLQKRGINAYPLRRIAVDMQVDSIKRQISLSLSAERPKADIHYTTDGTEPTLASPRYEGRPIICTDSVLLVAKLFQEGKPLDLPSVHYRADYHKGIGKQITYNEHRWNDKYPAGGERALLDGVRGTPTYLDGKWQGFTKPLDVTIDLGAVTELHHIFARFMQERIQWVYMPGEVEILLSEDGVNYRSVGKRTTQTSEEEYKPVFETFSFPMRERARYVRLRAANDRAAGHFIFTDEIVIW